MKKNELYKALKADGEDLPPFNLCKKEDLEKKYSEIHPDFVSAQEHDEFPPLDVLEKNDAESAKPELVEDAPTPPLLFFTSAGWCSELNRSYFIGMYRPRNEAEYNALRKYAEREV